MCVLGAVVVSLRLRVYEALRNLYARDLEKSSTLLLCCFFIFIIILLLLSSLFGLGLVAKRERVHNRVSRVTNCMNILTLCHRTR